MDAFMTLYLILQFLGLLIIIRVIFVIIYNVYQFFKVNGFPLFPQQNVNLHSKFGTWAVVTGCTDGIGKAYAFELAKRGLNIVLISRSEDKLKAVAENIEQEFNVKTKIIVADFSKGREIYDHIETKLNGIPVGILVNNVGSMYTYPTYLDEVPSTEIWNIINVNIGAVTMMTKMILPKMLENQRGAIVNISSGSELQPLPLMTVYAASKVYIRSFSDALRYEYKNKGITIQHIAPLFVTTKMNAFSHRLQESNVFMPSADKYAAYAVNTLGKLENSSGYWSHGFQRFFIELAPVWLRTVIGGKMNERFRKDYFKLRQQ